MQRGGRSKDTWVLADGPVNPVTLLAPLDPIHLEPATTELPSRVAENLFWLGRYVERAEHIVRLLRGFVARLAEHDATDDPRQMSALLRVLVGLKLLPEEFSKDNRAAATRRGNDRAHRQAEPAHRAPQYSQRGAAARQCRARSAVD